MESLRRLLLYQQARSRGRSFLQRVPPTVSQLLLRFLLTHHLSLLVGLILIHKTGDKRPNIALLDKCALEIHCLYHLGRHIEVLFSIHILGETLVSNVSVGPM